MRSALLIAAIVAIQLTPPPTAEQVRDRLDAYLVDYAPQLATLVASETLDQWVGGVTRSPTAARRLRGEVSFVGLPGDVGLQGFRRVTEVDGRRVDRGASMADLLAGAVPLEAAARLLEQSARHNLGTARNTNVPSLPIELLQPRHRARFSHELLRPGRIRGEAVSVLVATESAVPTIIRTSDGANSPSRVTAWVDARGRLLRAEVRLLGTTPQSVYFEPTVQVEFRMHDTLGLLVPTEMREEFWSAPHRRRGTGEGKYRDFRRFQTAARIVPPHGAR